VSIFYLSDIFKVEYCNGMTSKSGLGAHSSSLEAVPFDRSHTRSDWHHIVTMAISCIISVIKRDIGE